MYYRQNQRKYNNNPQPDWRAAYTPWWMLLGFFLFISYAAGGIWMVLSVVLGGALVLGVLLGIWWTVVLLVKRFGEKD